MPRAIFIPLVMAVLATLAAIGVLHSRHLESRARFAMSVTTLDNVLQARLHATRAYMIASNAAAGDSTFRLVDAAAAVDRAMLSVEDWLTGRSTGLAPVDPARRDPELRGLLLQYALSLGRFRAVLLGDGRTPGDLLEVRTAFADLESHHDLIERRTAAVLTALDRRERRDHTLTVFLLASIILGSGIVVDRVVRARERASHELQRRDAQLKLLVEQLPAITWTTDRELTVRSVGGRFLSRVPFVDALPGEVTQHVRNASPASAPVAAHRDALAGRSASFHFEADGKRFEARVEPLRDRTGQVGVVGVALDVTDRERSEERLRQGQKLEAVGRVAAGAAHDFNNLLAVIRSNAELLRMDIPADDGRRESVEEILGATTRGSRLVKELMTIGRQQPVASRALHLGRLVDEMQPTLQRLAGPDVQLAVESTEDATAVAADQTQMEQVLLNLVANARDAMPGGGRLGIRVAPVADADARRVQLIVADTGHGMDDRTRARIFEPFFTTKSPERGTGLGLATVYGIVRQAGGAITVESAPGAGTTFTIDMPAAADA